MIRVVVVDDSVTARRFLARLFAAAGDFEVVGEAASCAEAVKLVRTRRPDLVSLDVFLPDGNAPEAARALMAVRPTPIVLVSNAPRGAAEVFEALAAGALDLLRKPKLGEEQAAAEFLQLMRTLSRVTVRPPRRFARGTAAGRRAGVVVIGSSTGGPGALRELLAALPPGFGAPVVVAQHLVEGFEPGLAQWLSATTALKVAVAGDDAELEPGHVLLGASNRDIVLTRSRRVTIQKSGPGTYHPSADALFTSAAKVYGAAVLAIVLSGIGADGVAGARAVSSAGGMVFAQDEQSCAVYGMPAAVAKAGLASVIAPPAELGRAALALVERN